MTQMPAFRRHDVVDVGPGRGNPPIVQNRDLG